MLFSYLAFVFGLCLWAFCGTFAKKCNRKQTDGKIATSNFSLCSVKETPKLILSVVVRLHGGDQRAVGWVSVHEHWWPQSKP